VGERPSPHQPGNNTVSVLSASLSAAPMQMRPISGLLGPTSGQIGVNQAHITDLNPALLKGPSSFTKPNSKKNRKSPAPGDFDSSVGREDVQSPAYSDISDDSTPQIVDAEDSALNSVGKKTIDSVAPSQMGPLGGYGMFPMYPNMAPYYPPGHPEAGKPVPVPQSPSVAGRDLKDANNAPPLDLISKPPQLSDSGNSQQSTPPSVKDLSQNIPPQGSQGPGIPSQGPPGKPGLPPHYYPIGYYATFPNQRRSSIPSGMPPNSMPQSIKEEQSPSGPMPQSSSSSSGPPTGAQSLQSMQQASKNIKTSMMGQSPQQKPSNLSSKDSSKSGPSEDKEPPKVKQEGQKPTMETQGPPPPPTSQFYLHPSFASPYPFEPIYRNMLVSAPFNAPAYHLPMARIPPPEDLSRNPNTKALDLLQHHANQYYNSHKIHELSEHALNVND
ncbi:unnamed protein product, partial [Sphagnum compactum]